MTSPTASRRRKHPLWRRVLTRLALGATGLLVLALGAFFVAYLLIDVPDPNANFQAETSFVYYADGRSELGSFAVQNRQNVTLAAVPQHVEDAVIAAEDRSFYDNAGIDVLGIVRAAWNNARGQTTQGASTITQQYVKVLYLSQEQSYTRKVKEGILALKVQRELPKDEILTGYLNTIYFGRGAYGVQAAAEAYFDKDIDDVTVREGAVLATVLNSPATLDPREGRQAQRDALDRYRYVLAGMVEAGDLDQATADRMSRRLPPTVPTETEDSLGGPEGYLLAMVESELRAEGFTEQEITGGGLRVTTTFDQQAMAAAARAVREQPLGRLRQLHVALASVEPGTGALRAVYGGPDYVRSDLNWALAGGQPGSAFKPFALLAGLRDGFSLGDVFDGSSPYAIEGSGETVENQGDSGGSSFGSVTLEYATQQSINTAYVDLTLSMQDGAAKVVEAAELAGIPRSTTEQIAPVPVVALGVAPVSTVDMANAFGTFAANGRRADWFVVEKVTDSTGEAVYTHKDTAERAFTAGIASDVSYALQQVVEQGTGTAAAGLRCPAAGKTGTATSEGGSGEVVSSSWFVGYTPTLSTAVMYVRGDGNDALDGYLPSFYGGDYPARTWTAYMSDALGDSRCVPFPEPAFVSGTPATTAPPATTFAPAPSTSAPTTQPPPSTQPTEPPTPETTEPPAPTTTRPPPTTQPPTTQPPPTQPEPEPEPEPTEPPQPTQPPNPPDPPGQPGPPGPPGPNGPGPNGPPEGSGAPGR